MTLPPSSEPPGSGAPGSPPSAVPPPPYAPPTAQPHPEPTFGGQPPAPWWPADGQYGPPGPVPPRKGGHTALLVGVIAAVGFLLVAGLGGSAIWVLTSRSHHSRAAGAHGSATSGPRPGSAHTSAAPSPSGTSEQTTSPSPTGEAAGDRLSNTEYHDWHFQLGDVKLDATKTGGRDFDTCRPMQHHNSLTTRGCRYGIELDYSADHDRIRFLHMILVFDTSDHAKKAADDLTQDDLTFNRKALHPHFKVARWEAKATNQYVVITVCSANSSKLSDKVDKYLHYSNADESAALLWRD